MNADDTLMQKHIAEALMINDPLKDTTGQQHAGQLRIK